MGGRGLAIGSATLSESARTPSGGGGGADALSKSLFEKGDVKILGYGKAEQAHMRRVFGRTVSEKELGKLVGAPDGSTIHVSFNKSDPNSKFAFKLDVKHPYISTKPDEGMTRYIFKQGREVGIYNGTFYANKSVAPEGFGTRVFANQVYNARESGVSYIRTMALGFGSVANGAYTWGRLGYDAPLSNTIKAKLLTQFGKSYRTANTINELIKRGGSEFWRANAESGDMIFDLGRSSTSIRILNSYMRGKNINIGRKTPKR